MFLVNGTRIVVKICWIKDLNFVRLKIICLWVTVMRSNNPVSSSWLQIFLILISELCDNHVCECLRGRLSQYLIEIIHGKRGTMLLFKSIPLVWLQCIIDFLWRIERHLRALNDLPTALAKGGHHDVRIRHTTVLWCESYIRYNLIAHSFDQALATYVWVYCQILGLAFWSRRGLIIRLFCEICDILREIARATFLSLSVSTPA